jgi:hypothetical protein
MFWECQICSLVTIKNELSRKYVIENNFRVVRWQAPSEDVTPHPKGLKFINNFKRYNQPEFHLKIRLVPLSKRKIHKYTVYTITLITVFVPTYSVWYVILFRETGVVQRITHRFSYFFLFIYWFYTWYKEKACCIKSKANHVSFNKHSHWH